MLCSNTPWVDGYVTIKDDNLSPASDTLFVKSVKSILPFWSHLTMTTFKPAMIALAGFVPWADSGIKQIFLCELLALWYSLILNNPAYSPWAPELGWNDTASKPVTL